MPVPYSVNAPFSTTPTTFDQLAVEALEQLGDVLLAGDAEVAPGDVRPVPREFAFRLRRGGEHAALQAAGRGNLHRVFRNRFGFLLARRGEGKEERQNQTGHQISASGALLSLYHGSPTAEPISRRYRRTSIASAFDAVAGVD
jgi:hypothetical protein